MSTSEWLRTCVVPAVSEAFSPLEREDKIKTLRGEFGGLLKDWLVLEGMVQDQDEIWLYETPFEYWESLCGESGVALVRDGEVIAQVVTEMN